MNATCRSTRRSLLLMGRVRGARSGAAQTTNKSNPSGFQHAPEENQKYTGELAVVGGAVVAGMVVTYWITNALAERRQGQMQLRLQRENFEEVRRLQRENLEEMRRLQREKFEEVQRLQLEKTALELRLKREKFEEVHRLRWENLEEVRRLQREKFEEVRRLQLEKTALELHLKREVLEKKLFHGSLQKAVKKLAESKGTEGSKKEELP